METKGIVSSSSIDGEARLLISADAILIETDSRALSLSYADIIELKLLDYAVAVATNSDSFTLSHLGYDTEPFYEKAFAAYNAKVLESLFVSGTPLLETKGNYAYSEQGVSRSGAAVIQLYERCLVILPANLDARRIPLCFTTNIEAADYRIIYTLDNGDSYSISKIGYDFEPLERLSMAQLLCLRKQASEQVRCIDSSLSAQQAEAAAAQLVEGAAAPIGELNSISSSLTIAIEVQISHSRIAGYYQILKGLCDVSEMAFGFREDVAFAQRDEQLAQQDELGIDTDDIGTTIDSDIGDTAAPYLIWLIAPSKAGGVCAVEYAGAHQEAAATYIFEYAGEWGRLRRRLNHAMEAIGFRREVISLSDEQMRQPGYECYRMAIERNESLAYIRSCYCARIVHSSEESWGREIASRFSSLTKLA